MRQSAWRLLTSITGVAFVTFVARSMASVNATTVGFAYLLLVLLIASTWGFVEACVSSALATLALNFFFLPPVHTFTIADSQNWVAFFSFLTTSLIASRLSAKAERRAQDATERQQDVERLYSFSRAILLVNETESFPKQLVTRLSEIFELSAATLYERRTGQFFRAGPSDFDGLDSQLRDAALNGTSFSDAERRRIIVAVRLGSEPIASLALQGVEMPDSVLQGIGTLVAIGLERALAQDLAHQIEAARQTEQLRTALIDSMAHEFKTPLTSVKAATTSLLSRPDQSLEARTELLKVADEEADHLRALIDQAVEMARLDNAEIAPELELANVDDVVQEVVASMRTEIDDRPLEIVNHDHVPPIGIDRRLVKLALKQLLDNALKYSSPGTPVTVQAHQADGAVVIDITDHGKGIPPEEQHRIFDRFYRSSSVRHQMPGTGLGLSIAYRIARAHGGDLTVESQPGRTMFRLTLPMQPKGSPK